eukprot:TRINITY_DN2566_c0_g1_i1.p1 TRINITY_DN2566_c0_g1~~TRINITY_DN2566_c0_g1_i1.p1  ORF type:complete len:310 (-),score=60.43 TRINITY_DN2566_c0_g1_i1:42-971(-)
MKLQWGILAVALYGLLEACAWYFYRWGTNSTGYYSTSALMFVVLLANIKKTVSRVLVLLVSMGLGIVKWTLGTTRLKIGLLAVFYMFFSFLLQTIREIETLAKKEVVSEWVSLLVVVPAAILDTGFYYWIILSLVRTMQQLTLRKQGLKLEMYKIFFGILVFTGILSVSIIAYQSYLNFNQLSIPWQYEWMFDAFWDYMFWVIMTVVSFIWRPRSNNTRYGYGEFFSDETEDRTNTNEKVEMETISVTGTSLTNRKKGKSNDTVLHIPTTYDQKMNTDLSDFEKELMSFELDDEGEGEASVETEMKKLD